MSANTSIEWCDRTWNPVRGCSVISSGCVNCYAMKMAHRFSGPGRPYEGLTKLTERSGPQWTGVVRPVDSALVDPLKWRTPARVFVNSMSDLFHESVPFEFIDQIFAVMGLAHWHTFQVLTKRADRMREYIDRVSRSSLQPLVMDWPTAIDAQIPYIGARLGLEHMRRACARPATVWPMPNVWLGVSVENPSFLNRIDELLQTPAGVRFVSLEPLLADLGDISRYLSEHRERVGNGINWRSRGLDWVIVGGESGPRARPCALEWIDSLRDQCKAAGVACFVKQLGAFVVSEDRALTKEEQVAFGRDPNNPLSKWAWRAGLTDSKGADVGQWPDYLSTREFPEVRP